MQLSDIIDKRTGISIGLCLTLAVPLTMGAWKLSSTVAQVSRDVAAINDQLGQAYTITQASEDALREALANPGHKVPDPRHPGQYLVVELPRDTQD